MDMADLRIKGILASPIAILSLSVVFLISALLAILHGSMLYRSPEYVTALISITFASGIALFVTLIISGTRPVVVDSLVLVMTLFVYGSALLMLFFNGAAQIPYMISFGVASLSYLSLLSVIPFKRIVGSVSSRLIPVIPILIAAILRIPFLMLPERLSGDIYAYEFLGSSFASGKYPYADIFVPYPPGFSLFLWGISSANLLACLKLIFLLLEICAIVLIVRYLKPLNRGFNVALSYALCPLPIIEIAWQGHMDGFTLFLLVAIFLMRKRPALSGSVSGFALTVRPTIIAALPPLLYSLRKNRRWFWFLVALVISGSVIVLPFLPYLGTVVYESAGYHLSRQFYNSLWFTLQWVTNLQFNIEAIGAALTLALATILNLLYYFRKKWHLKVLKLYGYLIGALLFAWGVVIIAFPFAFAGGIPLSPDWPYYRPSIFYISYGASVMLTAVFLILYCRWEGPIKGSKEIGRMVFYNLFASVFVLTIFYPWYMLWSLPFAFIAFSKKGRILMLAPMLMLAPLTYYSSDFKEFGADAPGVKISPDVFRITSITGRSGGAIPNGSISYEGDMMVLSITGPGNITSEGHVSIPVENQHLLHFRFYSDIDLNQFKALRLSIVLYGHDINGKSIKYILPGFDRDEDYIRAGAIIFVNMHYIPMKDIKTIQLIFENYDKVGHKLTFGEMMVMSDLFEGKR